MILQKDDRVLLIFKLTINKDMYIHYIPECPEFVGTPCSFMLISEPPSDPVGTSKRPESLEKTSLLDFYSFVLLVFHSRPKKLTTRDFVFGWSTNFLESLPQ